jgi:hypothetical protein
VNFVELKLEADQKLIEFLKTDLELGFTFANLAEQHREEANRQKSLEHARTAVETIRRFQGRIADHPEFVRIQTRASELEKLLNLKYA